jgi:hypothetical protein
MITISNSRYADLLEVCQIIRSGARQQELILPHIPHEHTEDLLWVPCPVGKGGAAKKW